MRRIIIICLLFFIGLSGRAAVNLILEKTIGDDREDYTFYTITGAVLSGNKDIYVLDGKGPFIAQFNWKGVFVRRTGQKGQGPNDFYIPLSLDIYKNALLILDNGNRRIARGDLNLKKFTYFEMPLDHKISNHLIELKNGMFFGNFSNFREGRGRLGVINRYGDLEKSFFSKTPIEIEFDAKKLTDAKDFPMLLRHRVISDQFIPVFAVDEKREHLLVSFRHPDNPINFYVYTIEGKMTNKFSYSVEDKRYKFSDFLLQATFEDIGDPKKYPAKSFKLGLYSLYIHKGHYIANLWLEEHHRDKLFERKGYCLVFDERGKLKGKIALGNAMRFFSVSSDGYVLASTFDEEIIKLYIYKLNID